MSITKKYQQLRAEIPEQVTIVLAAKTRTAEEVAEAIAAGATDIGQNYVQEAETIYHALGAQAKRVRWHSIGAIQTNKINKALEIFDVFQTVDSLKHARALNARAARIKKVLPVYLEVNIGVESSKAGLPPEYDEIELLVREMAQLENVKVEGLMTMGPLSDDPETSRPYFHDTKKIFDQLRALNIPNVNLHVLSMGMSASYRVAIEEGATMVRLGTIVFGERHYS